MNWSTLFTRLFDPYELKARLFPGLLLLIPVIVFFAILIGPKDPLLVALGSVLATCGGPYFLASFVRSWGQRAQNRLNKKWGGQPTTILLRHRDRRLPSQTKNTYHRLIEKKLGLKMPTAQEETANPEQADDAYVAAANALRPLTTNVKKFPFVFKELVAYGYNRNAYGSRWAGAAICVVTIMITVAHGSTTFGPGFSFDIEAVKRLDVSHVLTLIPTIVLLLVWLFHFNARTVEQAGHSYATRLWEALNKVPGKSSAKEAKPVHRQP
jgi:hypothetical protein